MKVNVYSIEGKPIRKIELPSVFNEEIRPDLVARAVIASITSRIQPWGTDPMAGKRTTAENWGTGHGIARVPRIKAGPHRKGRRAPRYRQKFRSFPAAGRAAFVPQAVGGRRAHPPRVDRVIKEKINRKERRKAIRSAIAATAIKEIVASRGHIVSDIPELPLVVEDKFQELKKTKEVVEVMKKLRLWDDILRASKKKIRAGKGKMRGRKYKRKKGPLIVIAEDKGVKLAARNLPGVDVVRVENLNAELLAPGTHIGRLTLWSESAIKKLENLFNV